MPSDTDQSRRRDALPSYMTLDHTLVDALTICSLRRPGHVSTSKPSICGIDCDMGWAVPKRLCSVMHLIGRAEVCRICRTCPTMFQLQTIPLKRLARGCTCLRYMLHQSYYKTRSVLRLDGLISGRFVPFLRAPERVRQSHEYSCHSHKSLRC